MEKISKVLRFGSVLLIVIVAAGSLGRYQASLAFYGYWGGLFYAITPGQIIALIVGVVLYVFAGWMEKRESE